MGPPFCFVVRKIRTDPSAKNALNDLGTIWQLFEARLNARLPFRAAMQGLFDCISQFVRAILSENADKKVRLRPILAGFRRVRARLAPLCDDKLVNRVALWPGDLDEDT